MKTREHYDIDEAFIHALLIASCGDNVTSRNGDSFEWLGSTFAIADARRGVLQNERRHISYPYAIAETLWYWSRERSIERLLPYAPSYAKYAGDDGVAHGAYGDRIAHNGSRDQLEHVTWMLSEEPRTRRAVVTIFDAAMDTHNLHEEARCLDVPCTLSWQFVSRNGRLHMIVTMRSEDIWLGLPYDVFAFTTIQQAIAGELGLDVGAYYHQVGSMHLYAKHADAAHETVMQSTPDVEYSSTYLNFETLTCLCDLEAYMRDRRITSENELITAPAYSCLTSYGRELAMAVAAHWFAVCPCNFNVAMRKGMEHYVNRRRS